MSRIVTVFGATGSQGASVVEAILEDGTFTPRGVTRDVASRGAKELASRGAQVVQADISDETSVRKALEGSEAVFIVTVPFTAVSELTQASNIINASKAVGVKYVIWSSLPETNKASNGKFTQIQHFNIKAEIDDVLRASGLPHTIIQLPQFLENIFKFADVPQFPPILKSDPPGSGSYTLSLVRAGDDTQIFAHVEKDLGASVLVLLKSYNDESKKDKVLGQTFLVATQEITGADYADILSKVLGKPVKFISLTEAGMPFFNDAIDFSHSYWKLPKESGVPDRRLIDLGVKFSSVKAFAEDNKVKLLAL